MLSGPGELEAPQFYQLRHLSKGLGFLGRLEVNLLPPCTGIIKWDPSWMGSNLIRKC